MSPRNDEWSESVPDTLSLIMELQIAVLLALLQKILNRKFWLKNHNNGFLSISNMVVTLAA